MNKFLLVATLGPALHCACAAEPPDRPAKPRLDADGHPVTVVLPTALQHELHKGWTLALGQGKRLRVGLLAERGALTDTLPLGTTASIRTLVGIEFEQQLGWGFANIKFGSLRQTSLLLGRLQASDSPFNPATHTAFTAASVGYALTPSLALVGMLALGRTAGVRNAALMPEGPPAMAAALSLGLSARNLFQRGDSAGVALIAPTRGAGVASVDGAPAARTGMALGLRYGVAF